MDAFISVMHFDMDEADFWPVLMRKGKGGDDDAKGIDKELLEYLRANGKAVRFETDGVDADALARGILGAIDGQTNAQLKGASPPLPPHACAQLPSPPPPAHPPRRPIHLAAPSAAAHDPCPHRSRRARNP